MIIVNNLYKTFRTHRKAPGLLGSIKALYKREHIEKHAVQPTSFTINAGEIVGLVGANGAGKTTLVKMLAGILFPTGGEASVLGFRPWDRSDQFRREISLIMGQKAQLWWDLPAADCFLLLKDIYSIDEKIYRTMLDYLVSSLDVGSELNIPIRRLSLGERMKMELIAALLHQPKVVFLDEPTIGLDLTAQRAIRKFILEYSAEHKPALILTSHYMEDIEELCKRLMIMRDGAIVYDGETRKISNYANQRIIHVEFEEAAPSNFTSLTGEVVAKTEHSLALKTSQEKLPLALQEVMFNNKIRDIRIEEEDISSTIERIMQTGVI